MITHVKLVLRYKISIKAIFFTYLKVNPNQVTDTSILAHVHNIKMEQANIFIQRKKNFISFERKFLLECILEHKNVIENKKTNGTSVKNKQESWKKIAISFNASLLMKK